MPKRRLSRENHARTFGIRPHDSHPSPDRAAGAASTDGISLYVDEVAVSIVAGAVAAAEVLDPSSMLGIYSFLATALRSIVTRAGQAIPAVIAKALSYDPDLTVLQEFELPLTRAATEVVEKNRHLVEIDLAHDLHPVGSYTADLIVIDTTTRHATILECRRGSVPFSSPKIASTLRTLRVAALSARSRLEADGFRVATVSCGVIDRYGRAGYDAAMTVGPEELDSLFEIPVLPYLDRLDARIREELEHRLGPIPQSCSLHDRSTEADKSAWGTSVETDVDDKPPTNFGIGRKVEGRLSLSRLIGPAEVRRSAAARRRRGGGQDRLH
ncbi:hypothetical protein [Jiella sp. M17.18]|uniref:hypothetical protein n=1 Tax=Jiella sp. M17.18 TaxID=3234247 RepID=UPI0034DF3100